MSAKFENRRSSRTIALWRKLTVHIKDLSRNSIFHLFVFFHSFIAPNLYYGYMKIKLHAKLIQSYKNFRCTHHFRYTKHFPIFFCSQKNSSHYPWYPTQYPWYILFLTFAVRWCLRNVGESWEIDRLIGSQPSLRTNETLLEKNDVAFRSICSQFFAFRYNI